MNGPPLKQGGTGYRALRYALLASLALHAALLLVSPDRKASREPAAPAPIVARLVAPEAPPPAPAPAPRPIAKPTSKALPRTRPAPSPSAQPEETPPAAIPPHELRSAPPSSQAAPAAPAISGSAASAARSDAQAAAPTADAASVERYRLDLIGMARRYKRYPRVALDNNWEGRVVVRMVVGANGMIASIQVSASSGHDVLDKQALDMIRKAKPLVPIPAAMRGREFAVEIPVRYDLKDQGTG